ncbi:MAG: CYTH domain-containing protein [Brumimicrobium sp.]|nr:CYTH domain-containing protein [Brumimicrobium sp.]MCO5267761.1 CYTH domain-containing protein [Brumimicrobium sp.]
MGVEIERKFLVHKEKWEQIKPKVGKQISQGYLMNTPELVVRIRTKGDKGFVTIKGHLNTISRTEYEYEIPYNEAMEMLQQYCPKRIEKTRFEIRMGNHLWEVDEFVQPLTGLILAEIELQDEMDQFEIPDWIKEEVTHLPEYYNANMLK